MKRFPGIALLVLSAVALLGNTGCLTDNFWAEKWSEVVNRGIFGAINAAIGAATNNAIQI